MHRARLPMAAAATAAAAAAVMAGIALLPAGPVGADLGASEWKAIEERASKAVQQGDSKAAAAAVRDAARDLSPRAARLIVAVVSRMVEQNEVYEAGCEAADALGGSDKAFTELVRQGKGTKDPKVRIWLIDALKKRAERGAPRIAELLDDKEDKVQLAAVRALVDLATAEGTDALIALMEKLDKKGPGAQGVVYGDLRNGLARILGAKLDSGFEFRSYFDARRGEFVNGKGLVKAGEGTGGARGGGGQEVGSVTLFGQEIRCKNVVIILDRSGSMERADPYPPGSQAGTSARGGPDTGDGTNDPERKRIARAKKELIKVCEELAKVKAKVNIVVYSSDVEFWRPEGVHDLGGDALKSVKDFISKLEADGVTATDTALLYAFEKVPQADCFYLISDGFATHDGQSKVPTPRILAAVAEANRFKKVQINCFGFIVRGQTGDQADPELMQALAAQAGGTYSEIE